MSGGGAKYSHHMTMPQFTPELVDEKNPTMASVYAIIFLLWWLFFKIYIMTALIHQYSIINNCVSRPAGQRRDSTQERAGPRWESNPPASCCRNHFECWGSKSPSLPNLCHRRLELPPLLHFITSSARILNFKGSYGRSYLGYPLLSVHCCLCWEEFPPPALMAPEERLSNIRGGVFKRS